MVCFAQAGQAAPVLSALEQALPVDTYELGQLEQQARQHLSARASTVASSCLSQEMLLCFELNPGSLRALPVRRCWMKRFPTSGTETRSVPFRYHRAFAASPHLCALHAPRARARSRSSPRCPLWRHTHIRALPLESLAARLPRRRRCFAHSRFLLASS